MTTPTRSGHAPVAGASLFYEVAGEGEPLVLVHAGIADSRMWEAQVAPLAAHFGVVRYDMRGYGQSPIVAGDFAHHEDLRGLLDFLGIERAALVGCSKGGNTILDFALAYPERASALVLVNSPPSGWEFEGDPPPQWDELVAAFRAGDLARTAELEVEIWVDGPFRAPDQVDPQLRALVREMNLIALTNEATKLGTERPAQPPAVGQLERVAAPTLVLVGELDAPEIARGCEALAMGIPGAQQVVIAGTAHLPNMERPDEFNKAVLNFLRAL